MSEGLRPLSTLRRTVAAATLLSVLAACGGFSPSVKPAGDGHAASPKAFDVTYLLNVSNETLYNEYRADIAPICERHGVKIRHDFGVSKVHGSESAQPVNRVFLATFPSPEGMKAFFSDPAYQVAKKKLDKSVASFEVVTHP